MYFFRIGETECRASDAEVIFKSLIGKERLNALRCTTGGYYYASGYRKVVGKISHSKRVEKMEKYTRNEWGRWKNYTRNEWRRIQRCSGWRHVSRWICTAAGTSTLSRKFTVKTTLVSSVVSHVLHPFRVCFHIFSTRFECSLVFRHLQIT